MWSPILVDNMLHGCSFEHKGNVYTPNLGYYKNFNNTRRQIKNVKLAAHRRVASTAQTNTESGTSCNNENSQFL
jgi:hypothetical protein